jgi:hypothetical protein
MPKLAGLLMLAALLAGAGLTAGCQAAAKHIAVSDIRVMVFDETGKAPPDIPRSMRHRIPEMATEMGLIGRTVGDPGVRVMIQGRITDFPSSGSDSTQSTWINSGPMTVEYTASKEDGEELGTIVLTTSPRDGDHARECPYVFTQSREVVRWLLGR